MFEIQPPQSYLALTQNELLGQRNPLRHRFTVSDQGGGGEVKGKAEGRNEREVPWELGDTFTECDKTGSETFGL